MGGILAIIILLIFLNSWQSTVVISISIPISVVAAFVAMALLGKTINVISLAGIAFAVGMVVDAAIVVLENIYRIKGKRRKVDQSMFGRNLTSMAGCNGFCTYYGISFYTYFSNAT